MSESQNTASMNVQSASMSKSDDSPRYVCVQHDDANSPSQLKPKELKGISYDKAISSDLRDVLELLVQEMSNFRQLETNERTVGYEKLHPLLLQLARFFQKDKELISQMTSFLLSNHDFLCCLMLVADSTLKGLFSNFPIICPLHDQYLAVAKPQRLNTITCTQKVGVLPHS